MLFDRFYHGEGIATSGNTVHLVYGTSIINYRRSNNAGATWSSTVPIGTGVLHSWLGWQLK